MKVKLTKSNIESLAHAEKRFDVWDTHLAGYGVRVSSAGAGASKIFFVRLRVFGSTRSFRRFTLGKYGQMTPTEARAKAIDWIAQIQKGIDPTAKIKKQGEIPTLAEAASAYLALRKRAPSTIEQYQYNLRHLGKIKNRRLDEITHLDVAALHRSMSDMPYMANRVVGLLSSIYRSQSVAHEIRNPVDDWKESGGKKNQEKRRKVDKPSYVLPRWHAGILAAIPDNKQKIRDIFLFAIFSGLRKSEVCRLRWSQISDVDGTFEVTIKGNKQLTVHLTDQLREILIRRRAARWADFDWVFPNGKANPRTGQLPTGPVASFKGRFKAITEAGGARFYLHATRNNYLRVCRDMGYPLVMRKALVGHEPADDKSYTNVGGDVTEGYEGDYSPSDVAAAAQIAADRIEAIMLGRLGETDAKPAFLSIAAAENAQALAPEENVYSLEEHRSAAAK